MPLSKIEIKLSEKEAFLKVSAWCAYQERSHKEVSLKLYEFGLKSDEIEQIIFRLITENFLNEQRFAKSYAGGKFRMKKWGKLKIVQGLKQKDISANCIKEAMKEISDEDYENTLNDLLLKKEQELKSEKNMFVRKKKIADFAIRKGYESELVWDAVKKL